MSSLSYWQRCQHLYSILDDHVPNPGPSAFSVSASARRASVASDFRATQLDQLLATAWSAPSSKGKEVARILDVLRQVDRLRITTADFDLIGRVGQGQFGIVDAVRCKLDGKVYAMKTIDKVLALRAGQSLAVYAERHIHSLASPTAPVPQLLAAFQSTDHLHLVITYAPCGTLWDRLCSNAQPGSLLPMSEAEVRFWAAQMIEAIDWLHREGFVHRDIKPHNFVLFMDGRLLLTDFGSAAPLIADPGGAFVNQQHCILPVGTPDYVAPEVLELAELALVNSALGDHRHGGHSLRGYSSRVDWWSLGVTMYEMAVGRAPFWAESIRETYELILKLEYIVPAKLPRDLRRLFASLLSHQDLRLDQVRIRSHPFFSEVDWRQVANGSFRPPDGLAPLEPLSEGRSTDSLQNFDTTLDQHSEVTFDHFFRSSPEVSELSLASEPASGVFKPPSLPDLARWIGWSWIPSFDRVVMTTSPGPSASLAAHAVPSTPLRVGRYAFATPVNPTPVKPLFASRVPSRTRNVTERQAFQELVECVQLSVRKRLAGAPHRTHTASTALTSSSLVAFQVPKPFNTHTQFVSSLFALERWHADIERRLLELHHRIAGIAVDIHGVQC